MTKLKEVFPLFVLSLSFVVPVSATAEYNVNEDPEYIENTNKQYYEIYADESCDNNHILSNTVFEEGFTYDDIDISVDGYPDKGNYLIRTTDFNGKMLRGVYNKHTNKISKPALYVKAINCNMFNRYHKNKAVDNYGNSYKVVLKNTFDSPMFGIESYEEVIEVLLDLNVLKKHQKDGLTITLKTYLDEENDGISGKMSQNVYLDGDLIKRFLNTTYEDVRYVD